MKAEGREPSGKYRRLRRGFLSRDTGRLAPYRYYPITYLAGMCEVYSDPLGYFITWTCYGTWLPGDDRGWTKWHTGEKIPQPLLADWCSEQMTEQPLFLDKNHRIIVNDTVALHCQIRGWYLHAVNCRSNHCHTVVSANSHDGEEVRDQLKSWCKRKLKDDQRSREVVETDIREKWWTGKGSARYLFDEESLEAAIRYTREAQDVGGSKCT